MRQLRLVPLGLVPCVIVALLSAACASSPPTTSEPVTTELSAAEPLSSPLAVPATTDPGTAASPLPTRTALQPSPTAVTPTPIATSEPIAATGPLGLVADPDADCSFNVWNNEFGDPDPGSVLNVSFDLPEGTYDWACEYFDFGDHERITESPQCDCVFPLKVTVERGSVASWFSELNFAKNDAVDAAYLPETGDSEFAPQHGLSAWFTDLSYPEDPAFLRSGPHTERHYVLDLTYIDRLHIVADDLPDSGADWETTVSALDELVASMQIQTASDQPPQRVLPTQGGSCDVGIYWRFDLPPDWFTDNCHSYNTSSESDIALQCECWPPIWSSSSSQSIDDILTTYDEVVVMSDTEGTGALNGRRVVTFSGEWESSEGLLPVRVVVVDLTSERFVLTSTESWSHAGPGHTAEDTLTAQTAIVTSLRTRRELVPLRDVPVCAVAGPPADERYPHRRHGDVDGDGLLDSIRIEGQRRQIGDELVPLRFRFELGNGGYVVAETTPNDVLPAPLIGQNVNIVRPRGLNRDALSMGLWTDLDGMPNEALVQLNGCELVVSGIWGRQIPHDKGQSLSCWIETADGEILRSFEVLYNATTDQTVVTSEQFYVWTNETITELQGAPATRACG